MDWVGDRAHANPVKTRVWLKFERSWTQRLGPCRDNFAARGLQQTHSLHNVEPAGKGDKVTSEEFDPRNDPASESLWTLRCARSALSLGGRLAVRRRGVV